MTGNKPYTVPVYKGKPLTEFSRLSDVCGLSMFWPRRGISAVFWIC